MNKCSFVLVLLLSSFLCFSQMRVSVSIQKNNKTYPDKNYFFTKIIDFRTNTASIGKVYKSDRVNEYQAVFKKNLAQEFFVFLKDVYPNEKAQHKILIRVNEFQIGHLLAKKDSGLAKLDVDFYEFRNDSVSFISNYSERMSETAEDVSLSHPNRIKRILLHATSDLEKHLNTTTQAPFTPLSQMNSAIRYATVTDSSQRYNPASAIVPEADYSQERMSKEDSLSNVNQYPNFFFFLVGGQTNICPSTLITGANLSFLFHLSKTSRFLLGPNVNYSAIIFLDKNVIPDNSSYQIRSYDFGLRLLRQIKKIAFFNCNTHFMIGKETLSVSTPMFSYNPQSGAVTQTSSGISTTESNFYGFQMDLGAYLMSPRRAGFYCGIDLTIRTTNSGVFDDEAGIKFNAGLKF